MAIWVAEVQARFRRVIEFVVRNVWRRYGGWWDGDPARLKPPTRAALATELAALGGMRHPGLVGVRDSGVDDEGRPFVVMDFVEGQSLAARLRDIRLSAHASHREAASGAQPSPRARRHDSALASASATSLPVA